jgi:hypothetical protein
LLVTTVQPSQRRVAFWNMARPSVSFSFPSNEDGDRHPKKLSYKE